MDPNVGLMKTKLGKPSIYGIEKSLILISRTIYDRSYIESQYHNHDDLESDRKASRRSGQGVRKNQAANLPSTRDYDTNSENKVVVPSSSYQYSNSPLSTISDREVSYRVPYESSIRSSNPEPSYGPGYQTFGNSSSPPQTTAQNSAQGRGLLQNLTCVAIIMAVGNSLRAPRSADPYPVPGRPGSGGSLPVMGTGDFRGEQDKWVHDDVDEPLNDDDSMRKDRSFLKDPRDQPGLETAIEENERKIETPGLGHETQPGEYEETSDVRTAFKAATSANFSGPLASETDSWADPNSGASLAKSPLSSNEGTSSSFPTSSMPSASSYLPPGYEYNATNATQAFPGPTTNTTWTTLTQSNLH